MTGRLKDKKSLITAAGKGIGRSTVLAFVQEGAQVLATDIDQDSLDGRRVVMSIEFRSFWPLCCALTIPVNVAVVSFVGVRLRRLSACRSLLPAS